jgi:sterol desaturase/sphingolipid hydroxylase (fatty acid hydroxylase superfamily)
MMQNKDYEPILPRNPITHQRHRREVFWQITFPILLVSLALLLLAVMAAGLSSEKASTWADISLIWMIIPALIFTLLTMIILAALVYLTIRLLHILPFYFFKGHNWFLLVNLRIGHIGDNLAEPFVRLRAWKAGAGALGRQVRRNR